MDNSWQLYVKIRNTNYREWFTNHHKIQLSEVKEEVKKEVNSLRLWKLYATHRT